MVEKDDLLFIVQWLWARNGATSPVLCEYCAVTLYSSPENIKTALAKGMHVACPKCAKRLIKEHGGVIGGSIRQGAVINR